MKPHNYFWIGLFAILFWYVKICFIQLLPFEWWEELIIIDFIYFILTGLIYGEEKPNERSKNQEIGITFCVFTNILVYILWGIEESLKVIKLPKINLNNKLLKFNHWIDKLFEKHNKQKKSN